MKIKIFPFLFLCFSVSLVSCNSAKPLSKTYTSSERETPRNIIFLIGDGMGLSQISIANFYKEEPSNFERFPIVGLIKTSSSTHLITDSAAAATAFASGIKTFHQAVGLDNDSIPVPTIIDHLEARDFSTGLVVTKIIVHATPAAFFAHVPYRYDYEQIAPWLVDSDIDFIAGGGLNYFRKASEGKDLLSEFVKKGYGIDTTSLKSTVDKRKQLILLADEDLPWKTEGRGDFLPRATDLAISSLSTNKNGFFLMVEGSLIDTAAHDGELQYMIDEQLDFDATVGRVLDYAMTDKETLVIVTADHETGSFALSMDGYDYNKIKPTLYHGQHSATMVPVFAYGPGSELFSGVYDNTEIYHKIMQLLSN
ncbi:alkaline phosphatase [Constantimarinum furrinae]|uniref:Alkaline phosphatase n=1 Tax=Constantimarinum furrinae TaxID=2562285 RepID=A0A7G8PUI5_9FLAO|nr:alkaline phosphatase [Constantimarinum furrinae]QNJ98001.1 Alkaline phosphatase [Constantimarinum furrinae]